jgi:two-component system, chemotaxis family, CheB/CheR fusion protein
MMENDDPIVKLRPPPRLIEDLIDLSSDAYIVISGEGAVVFLNATARRLFAVAEAEIGRPFQDLDIPYWPAELRGRVADVIRNGRPIRLDDVEYQRNGGEIGRLAIDITPLYTAKSHHYATAIAFHDMTRQFQLEVELGTAIEALQRSNEELQSTNEEIEAANEELCASNEQLQVANQELRSSAEAANEYLLYAESVLGSINAGIVVLDSRLDVLSWNRWSENVWGLRADEVIGESVMSLDFGLPIRKLRSDIDAVLSEELHAAIRDLDAIDRHGRRTVCRVTVSPLVFEGDSVHGIVLLIEDISEWRQAAETSSQFGRLLGLSANQVYVFDADTLRFSMVNQGAEKKLGYSIDALRQLTLIDMMPDIGSERLAALVEPLRQQKKEEVVFETRMRRRDGSLFHAELCIQLLLDEVPPVFVCIVHDASDRRVVTEAD